MTRKIIHIDMDAFFASIEQRDNPNLRGHPIAVGYGGKRGVVAAASYEARRYGVRSAMASVTAIRKCPHITFVPPRFEAYSAVSKIIMSIFLQYTDKVEPLSIDEAFLDVTINHKNIPYATTIARKIKEDIFRQTNLTASAGVSYNKFLAKIASDYRKPNGMFVIMPQDAEAFIEKLPIERFFGVGRVTAKRMEELGIRNGFDLKQRSLAELTRTFGKAGNMYYSFARGVDNREVETEHVRKSLGAEETFMDDLSQPKQIIDALRLIADEVERRIKKDNFEARTLTLKVKYADFNLATRSRTIDEFITTADQMMAIANQLITLVPDIETRKVRLLGLSLKSSEIKPPKDEKQNLQLCLEFEDWPDDYPPFTPTSDRS